MTDLSHIKDANLKLQTQRTEVCMLQTVLTVSLIRRIHTA